MRTATPSGKEQLEERRTCFLGIVFHTSQVILPLGWKSEREPGPGTDTAEAPEATQLNLQSHFDN